MFGLVTKSILNFQQYFYFANLQFIIFDERTISDNDGPYNKFSLQSNIVHYKCIKMELTFTIASQHLKAANNVKQLK